MARKIDEDKLARIKQATMKTIVDVGIEKATIAMIAKNANVSGGYLYHLYTGKQALINELYLDKINSLNKELEFLIGLNQTSVASILQAFVQNRIVYAQNEPDGSKFFYQLLHNDNFVLNDELKENSVLLMKTIKTIGEQTGEIATNISLFQIQYHIIIYVVDYLHFKRKNFLGTEASVNIEVDYLVNNILTILKKDN
ncbi:TetR/AcrR family transcriptional regulator [Lutibacter agarilyticus]|nr:TetR/AcrR family transcriptional regulator [Lutibacter agarilyticus]